MPLPAHTLDDLRSPAALFDYLRRDRQLNCLVERELEIIFELAFDNVVCSSDVESFCRAASVETEHEVEPRGEDDAIDLAVRMLTAAMPRLVTRAGMAWLPEQPPEVWAQYARDVVERHAGLTPADPDPYAHERVTNPARY